MEYLLPHMDEFILDFDAEEALLQLQVLAAGQAQNTPPVIGQGPYPVGQKQSLPNAAPSSRGRQQQQQQTAGTGHPAQAVEPVQLDSQLDALRREIARLEQLKQKQGAAKASPKNVANGNTASRGTQKAASSKPTGPPNESGAARQGSHAAQRPPTAKRARLAPGEASVAGALLGAAASARRPDDAGEGPAAAAPRGPSAAAAARPNLEASEQPSASVQSHVRAGSKRPADGAEGGLTAQQKQRQQQPLAKLQQAQQRSPKVPSDAHQRAAGPSSTGADRSQSAGRSLAEPSLQHSTHPTTAALSSAGEGGRHRHTDENGVAGSARPAVAAQQHQQPDTGAGAESGAQQTSSQPGPGPPQKRARAAGKLQAATTSTSGATGGSPASKPSVAAATGPTAAQPVAARSRVAGARITSNCGVGTQGGSPSVPTARGKPPQVEVGALSAPPGSGDDDGSGGGVMGAATGAVIDAGGERDPAQRARRQVAVDDVGSSDICPEAEQAANMFLMTLMTQINGQVQDQQQAAAAARSPPRLQYVVDTTHHAIPQQGQQQQPTLQPAHSKDQALAAAGGASGLRGRAGGAGNVSARRAAAERTSAAVQRLRRKSSGVPAIDPTPRTATSLATFAGAGGPADVVAAATAEKDTEARGAAFFPQTRSGGVPGTHLPATGVQHLHSASLGSVPAVSTVTSPSARECRPAEPVADATTAAVQSGPGAASPAAACEAQGPLGAVSSPVAQPRPEGGPAGAVPSPPETMPTGAARGGHPPGLQPASAAHLPPWVQVHAGGWGVPADRAWPGLQAPPPLGAHCPMGVAPAAGALPRPPAASAGLGAALHSSMPLAGASPGSAPTAAAIPTNVSPPPPPLPRAAANPTHSTGPSTLPFRPCPPSGMMPPGVPPRFPFAQPLPGYPALMPPAGPFPGGTFWPGPPPAAQWREAPPEWALGPGQPAVSLVEVDVLARKELILLKWHMLQEIAMELETEWVEACRAHNRLRLLFMAQAQPGREAPAASPVPPSGGAEATAPWTSVPWWPEDAAPSLHSHLAAREHQSSLQPAAPLLQQPTLPPWPPHQQQTTLPQELHSQAPPTQQQQQQQVLRRQPSANQMPLQTTATEQAPTQEPPSARGAARADSPLTASAQTRVHAVNLQSSREAPGQACFSSSADARHEEAAPEQSLEPPPHPATLNLTDSQAAGNPRPPVRQSEQHTQRQTAGAAVRVGTAGALAADLEPQLCLHTDSRSEPGPGAQSGDEQAQQPVGAGASAMPGVPERHQQQEQQQQRQGAAAAVAMVQFFAAPGRGADEGCMAVPGLGQRTSDGGAAAMSPPHHPGLLPAAPGSPPRSIPTAAAAATAAASSAAEGADTGCVQAAALQPRERQPVSSGGDSYAGASANEVIRAKSAGDGPTCGDGCAPQSRSGGRPQPHHLRAPQAASGDSGPGGGAASIPETGSGPWNPDAAAPSGVPLQARQPEGGTDDVSGSGAATGRMEGRRLCQSAQQATTIWTPWGQADATGVPVPSVPSGELPSNGVASSTHQMAPTLNGNDGASARVVGAVQPGSAGGGEGDSSHGAGGSDSAAPFTGLSFKLSAAPVAGRRVSAMRVQSGPASASSAKALWPKRASPSLSAVVPAAVVQPRGRSLPVTAALGTGPSLSPAPGASAVAVAAAFPEPPMRVQTAPQVLPGLGSGSTRVRGASPDGLTGRRPQEPQAQQHIGSSSGGSVGLHEVVAAVARLATQAANHVQVTRPGANDSATLRQEHASQGLPVQQGTLEAPPPQQAARLGQEQPAQQPPQDSPSQQSPALPILASPHAASPALLYQGRKDVILTERSTSGAAGLISTLDFLTSKYTSPLSIFRSYSGGKTTR